MIKVEKDFLAIPEILKSRNRKEAFQKNIKDQKFNYGKTLYKPEKVKLDLCTIYNTKCVYCEVSLLNVDRHIEHYRPKNIYYWLAYSWDNLFLCCRRCNSAKGTNFDTINSRVSYNYESFRDIHRLGNYYDRLEVPKLINPEKEDILEDLTFDANANILSKNERVMYTIEICNLNRDGLRETRESILTDFINIIQKHYEFFIKKGDITRFYPSIDDFINKCNKNEMFYALRYFILHNTSLFFTLRPLQVIVSSLIEIRIINGK